MDLDHGRADLKLSVNDLEFAKAFRAFMEHLRSRALIENYRYPDPHRVAGQEKF